jgi:hypothetical protein
VRDTAHNPAVRRAQGSISASGRREKSERRG